MKHDRARGMTLVEVLVTVLCLTLLLSMVAAILVSVISTQKKIEATLLRERVGAAILDLIARDVEATYAYGLTSSFKGAAERAGPGEADRMQFVTAHDTPVQRPNMDPNADPTAPQPPGALAQPGMQPGMTLQQQQAAMMNDPNGVPQPPPQPPQLAQIGYFVRESRSHPGFLTLFRGEQRYVPDPATTPGQPAPPSPPPPPAPGGDPALADNKPHIYEVFDRVRSFGLRYLAKDPTNNNLAWQDRWDDPTLIPAAVEVTLEIVPDPREDRGLDTEARARKIYKTVIGIVVSNPLPPQQQTGQGAQPQK
jgi:type II secretory pathway pseudopilin PulG